VSQLLWRALRLGAVVSLLCQCSSRTVRHDGASGEGAGAASSGQGGEQAFSGAGGKASGGNQASAGEPGSGGSGGSAGSNSFEPPFMLGADISSVQEAVDGGARFQDTDGTQKDLLEILGNHGFNYVRLRAFVEPAALYGYANPTGAAQFQKAEDYCDTQHTLKVAREAKAAGMGFLLDLHYSDNWADPGKQVIPTAWRDAASIDDLAARLGAYTHEVVAALIEGGARPDMVQLGNEITPGLLIHVPAEDPQPDQWGNMNKVVNSVNGSAESFNNVATLLKAGVSAVRQLDPTIKIMLHLENTESFAAARDWVTAVQSRGVELDVLGLSCYTAWQGEPELWEDTFQQLAARLPDISFVIAEYNPERTRANQMMRDLPDGRGLGTFFWEPTQSGAWGASLFTFTGSAYTANADDFAEFDAIKLALGL
jgi:arabinogalactan endo-1,4-beta-galactosidase